ncbi:hypothetical protein JZU68_07470 [bacterium]|jgi:hypothetical protein|nr:hypothetical protein [bacterium]
MASRRRLKKTIQFVSSELITDVYFRCLLNKNMDEKVAETLVIKIVDTTREFILRANKPAGNGNPALVKAYYRSLYKAWDEKLVEIIKATEQI